MRDAAHYHDLLTRNPGATIGYTLAASAVYAARYGECEAEHRGPEEWRAIARDLRRRYGEHLTVEQVRREMVATPTRDHTLRVRLTEAEHAAICEAADAAGLTLGSYARGRLLPTG